jgi:signal recognition particle receptor subunit alpha
MFKFFVFQAGGLVLWPSVLDRASPDISTVNEYIQKVLLEAHDVQGVFTSNRVTLVTHHDIETNLYFSVSVDSQIAEQVTYLPELVRGVSARFTDQFQPILSQNAIPLPENFSEFTPDPEVEKYRGQRSKNPAPAPAPTKQHSREPSPTDKKPRKWTNTNRGEGDSESQVIGQSKGPTVEAVTKYDVEDVTHLMPTAKPASIFSGLFQGLLGEKILSEENLRPILDKFRDHLIAKNVANDIVLELSKAVESRLIGTKCGTFTRVQNTVTDVVREIIERTLTPDRPRDLIREIQTAKSRGQPFVMAFVGVNGVGKSTTLAKVAYLFKSHEFRVLIVACDTFRSGAIEQLKVHCDRLDIPLFEKGGKKRDPTPVAKLAKDHARENGFDVVLIDTAGRMQTEMNLMAQIARLVKEVKPDMTVFVAEALVGGNGSEQIRSFDKTLKDVNTAGDPNTRGIDGIILTKCDTVDDKIGAALTLVYETGHPIVYLGAGQHYQDLRRMKPDLLVSHLLSGF